MPSNLGIVNSQTVTAAPVYRSTSVTRAAAATLVNNPGTPSGSVSTDLLLTAVTLVSPTDTASPTVATGWTLQASGPLAPTGGTAQKSYLYLALPSASPGTSFTKVGVGGAWRVEIWAVSGASDIEGMQTVLSAANGTSVAFPAVTSSVANTLGMQIISSNVAQDTLTISTVPPTTNSTAGGNPGLAMGVAAYPSSGAQSALTGTMSGNCGFVGYSFAIKP